MSHPHSQGRCVTFVYFTLTLLFAEAATARFPRTENLAGSPGAGDARVPGTKLELEELLGAFHHFRPLPDASTLS